MSEIDNIVIDFNNTVDSISVEYSETINTIELALGQYVQNVSSVNGLLGVVNLTASAILSSPTSSGGFYSYSFDHNLSYLYPVVMIYNLENNVVFADISAIDENSVTINSMIDISGYKVVAQR